MPVNNNKKLIGKRACFFLVFLFFFLFLFLFYLFLISFIMYYIYNIYAAFFKFRKYPFFSVFICKLPKNCEPKNLIIKYVKNEPIGVLLY